jgi:hypothetical protein
VFPSELPGVPVPKPQFIHEPLPEADLKVFDTHFAQVFPADGEYPGQHAQSSIFAVPMGEVEPIGHVVQTLSPKFLYVPAAHSAQFRSSQKYPALHVQLSFLAEPGGELRF